MTKIKKIQKFTSMYEWSVFDDPANQKAIKSWTKDKTPKTFILKVEEPFVFTTEKEEEYNNMKLYLMQSRSKFSEEIVKN